MRYVIVAGLLACTACSTVGLPMKLPTNREAVFQGRIEDRDVVHMGATYLPLEKPSVDWKQARAAAQAYCLDWKGYPTAEPSGPTRHECKRYNTTGGCMQYVIVGDYVCKP